MGEVPWRGEGNGEVTLRGEVPWRGGGGNSERRGVMDGDGHGEVIWSGGGSSMKEGGGNTKEMGK